MLKNSALVTLTLRTSPDDCRTNSFGVVVRAAADGFAPVSATYPSSVKACSARRERYTTSRRSVAFWPAPPAGPTRTGRGEGPSARSHEPAGACTRREVGACTDLRGGACATPNSRNVQDAP